MKSRKLFQRCMTLTLMLVASLTLTQTQAQSSVKRRFEVSENGRLLAAIVTERTGDAQKVSILRHAQPAHVFTNFPTLSAGHVFIGRQKIFAYSSGANLVETSDCSFAASDNARKGCRSATAIRQRLADDMRLLRAVRPYDTNVEIQEVLFVIATGDDSLLQAEPPASLQVFERTLTDAAAAKASSQIRVAALKARAAKAMQGASPGTLEGCIDGCKENREMCLKDSGVRDKSACYSGYYTCYNNCQSKYAPAPMESAFD